MLYSGSSDVMFEPNFPAANLVFCDEECREGLQSGSSGNKDYVLKAGLYQVQITTIGTAPGLKLVSDNFGLLCVLLFKPLDLEKYKSCVLTPNALKDVMYASATHDVSYFLIQPPQDSA